MAREITQRELRNESGEIMRALDAGETFVITRRGVPVGELVPMRRSRFVPSHVLTEVFKPGPPIDFDAFRRDVDQPLDQDPTPRG